MKLVIQNLKLLLDTEKKQEITYCMENAVISNNVYVY